MLLLSGDKQICEELQKTFCINLKEWTGTRVYKRTRIEDLLFCQFVGNSEPYEVLLSQKEIQRLQQFRTIIFIKGEEQTIRLKKEEVFLRQYARILGFKYLILETSNNIYLERILQYNDYVKK